MKVITKFCYREDDYMHKHMSGLTYSEAFVLVDARAFEFIFVKTSFDKQWNVRLMAFVLL